MIRTAFYTAQKVTDGILPDAAPQEEFLADAKKAVLEYERHMSKFAFHQCIYVLDSYIRNASKYMARALKPEEQPKEETVQVLSNLFYMIRIAGILLHPIVPFGTEKLQEYLAVDDRIWSWETVFEPVSYFTGAGHKLKFLPPRTDFFTRHESQYDSAEANLV
jgi:methionyl-tRNA synthetase